jgi:predicted ATPase
LSYLRRELVLHSLGQLSVLHPFFGITFLVCKQAKLPVGKKVSFPINNAENEFLLQYYHPDLRSKYFFQPFKSVSRWLSPKYPSSGSQSVRTRGQLAAAFLHDRGTDQWGWSRSYINVLQARLEQEGHGFVPVFWLAVWLFRNRTFPEGTTSAKLVRTLVREFFISDRESEVLCDVSVPDLTYDILAPDPFTDDLLLRSLEPPPDATPREGGTLRVLQLTNVGPAKQLAFTPAERLSIITGDNGLGKTFLLECAWWGLTGVWAEGHQAIPSILHDDHHSPTITFAIAGRKEEGAPQRSTIAYDWAAQRWPAPKDRPTIPGLVVYARVDGSFAVWDPARHGTAIAREGSGLLLFKRDDVLDGLAGKIEGLIRDWVKWQNARDQSTFRMFCAVMERLSPPDMAPLRPGEPVRVAHDPRDIPTLVHNYAEVPFTAESAGVKRIVAIAYLLVWAWNEHRVSSNLAKKAPQNNIVFMVDEVEAHLHPKWQRVVLPALLDVMNVLGEQVKPQMIVATHSPLILASMESGFSDDSDKLFHLYLENATDVRFHEVPFLKHGTVDAWLTSDVFELKQPRSREGETALERAKQLLADSSSNRERIKSVHGELAAVLPAEDPFWPRWLHFAEMKGVDL